MPKPEIQSSSGWLKLAVISGVAYAVPMAFVFTHLAKNALIGVIVGLGAGALFGGLFVLGLKFFVRRKTVQFRSDPPDFEGEDVLIEGPANHFKGVEAVGGYLWVTERRVCFKCHGLNVQKHDWKALLAGISEVWTKPSLGIIDTGLHLRLADGECERFVVNRAKRWAKVIRARLDREQ